MTKFVVVLAKNNYNSKSNHNSNSQYGGFSTALRFGRNDRVSGNMF